jgi:hypothetical protein
MSFKAKAAVVLGGIVVFVLWFVFLAGGVTYSDTDMRSVDRDRLFAQTEQLLRDSDAWPADVSDGSVVVASSLAPYPVRTVRYQVDLETSFDKVVEAVRNENYSGKTRRLKPNKWEETLYEEDVDGQPHTWVRRSVHISPPPGGNRDAVVVYFEDQPDPKTYRVAFQSVDGLDGKSWPPVEDAVRFKVMPSMYKVEETAPGHVRVRKVEAVDPRGSMSTLMNNYFLSLVFFRPYMFQQAKDMRAALEGGRG